MNEDGTAIASVADSDHIKHLQNALVNAQKENLILRNENLMLRNLLKNMIELGKNCEIIMGNMKPTCKHEPPPPKPPEGAYLSRECELCGEQVY